MDSKVKIVIVVAVILVAALGITSGSSIQEYFTSNFASEGNNTTVGNETNTSINQTNNTTTTTPRNANYIGTEAAIEKGKTVIGDDPHIEYYALLNTDTDVPYYLVGGKIKNERGEEISQTSTVKVDAVTGEII